MNKLLRISFSIFSILSVISCGSASTPGSVSPSKLDETSFVDPALNDSATIQNTYNPPLRLESEVAPGYLIKVHSIQDQNLNGEYRISEQGVLELPYAVRVNASNSSLAELRSKIRDSYRTFFRGTPDIEITIKDRKVWVRAQGLVNKPGTYLLESTGGLDEVISMAEGLKAGADGISAPRFAKISADGKDATIRLTDFYAGNSNLVSNWRGGESVFFQNNQQAGVLQAAFDSKYINVLGQVKAPGEYAFKDQANFFYYLVQAGGPTDRANTEMILLVSSKSDDGHLKTSKLKLSDLEAAPILKGGDVLIVQADNRSDIEKDAGILGSLGGFIGAIATSVLVSK